MKTLLAVFLLIVSFQSYPHDIRMAVFEIYDSPNGLEMTIAADREKFLQIVKTEFPECFDDNLNQAILKYLEGRFSMEIDGNCAAFELLHVNFSNESIFLNGSFNLKLSNIKEVKMVNTCLIEAIPGHDNIMKLKLNNRTRSFRLNSKRTSTIATYND